MTDENYADFQKRDQRVCLFRTVWQELAKLSLCDAVGSVEYDRVSADWIAEGSPLEIATYIRAHANGAYSHLVKPLEENGNG